MKKRILSGIKPTGDVHLGGYLGAMREWPKFQSPDNEVFYFIADLHALNIRPSADELRSKTYDLVAWLLALGIDSENNSIYLQSQVPEHSELCWLLNNFVTMGELSRMTQYKDKASKNGSEGQLVALFTYPVLMAADILLYDADEVPVGADQTQHVELTRDIAQRFNGIYGSESLKLPKFTNPSHSARVMMLDDPTSKMSKSEGGDGCVYLSDSEDVISRKFSRAVTDSESSVRFDKENKPGVSNLLEILASVNGESIELLEEKFSGSGYGELKQAVAQAVLTEILPLQKEYRKLRADEGHLDTILHRGRERVAPLAQYKLAQLKSIIGLV
ncbi:tryptophan--tRNA ligase [bacterium]|nr:MAG: tryptophan--tRNA ligase [bacterium]